MKSIYEEAGGTYTRQGDYGKCHGKAESRSPYGMGAKDKQHPKPGL